MDALTVGRTSFWIAHRLSTIRDADMILVMNHGDVIDAARTTNCWRRAVLRRPSTASSHSLTDGLFPALAD